MPAQAPAVHTSPLVQALPSLQVVPLLWLDHAEVEVAGVTFELDTRVSDLGLREEAGALIVEHIDYERGGRAGRISVDAGDLVLVTLGSMTEASSLGAMDAAPLRGDQSRAATPAPSRHPTRSDRVGAPVIYTARGAPPARTLAPPRPAPRPR